MSKKFTQKALVGSVASALAFVGGAAVASTTNVGPSTTSSINSSSTSNAFVPGGIKVTEDGNTLSSSGGFITVKVSNATINGANSAATSINAMNSISSTFAAVTYDGANKLVATVGGASRTILTDISATGSIVALGSTGTGTNLRLISYSDASDTSVGTSTPVGRLYFDASSNSVLVLAVKAGTTTAETASINFASLSPLTANATGAINVVLSDGDQGGFSGVGITGGTFKVGEFTTTNLTATGATTLPAIPAGSTTLQQQGGILIKGVAGASSVSNGTTATFEVTLDSGAKWSPNAATSNISYSGLNGSVVPTVTGAGTTKLTIKLTGDTNEIFNSASRLEVVGGVGTSAALIDVTGVTAGATIKGAVKSTGSMASLNTTVDLATAVASGVTVALKDNAPTGVTVGFTGRTGVALDDFVTVTEKAAGSISGGTLFTVSLDKGAAFAANAALAFTGDAYVGTPSSVTPSSASSSLNSSTATDPSNASAGVLTVGTSTNKLTLDLSGATAGDVTLSISGAGMTGSVVVAKVQDATSSSASGTTPTVLVDAASSTALPDLIITESSKGALVDSGIIAVQLPVGVTFDNTVTPTLTVTDSAGVVQTGALVTPATTHYDQDNRTYGIDLAAAWDSATKGPFTIKVSGLKVKASTSAVAGALNLVVGGAANTLPLNATATSAISTSSDAGVKPTKATLKVGTVTPKDVVVYPAPEVKDQTKATITAVPFTPAGNDQNKPGAVYVAAIIGGTVFFMNSNQQFIQYTGATPAAFFEGNLSGTISVDVIKSELDLTPFKGAQLLFGYGLGIKGLGDPFKNMLDNVRYSVIFTVK